MRRAERGGPRARRNDGTLSLRQGACRRLRHGQHTGAHAVPLRGGAPGRVLARRRAPRQGVGAGRRQDRSDRGPAVARRRAQWLRRVVAGVAGVRAGAGSPAAPRRRRDAATRGRRRGVGHTGPARALVRGRVPACAPPAPQRVRAHAPVRRLGCARAAVGLRRALRRLRPGDRRLVPPPAAHRHRLRPREAAGALAHCRHHLLHLAAMAHRAARAGHGHRAVQPRFRHNLPGRRQWRPARPHQPLPALRVARLRHHLRQRGHARDARGGGGRLHTGSHIGPSDTPLGARGPLRRPALPPQHVPAGDHGGDGLRDMRVHVLPDAARPGRAVAGVGGQGHRRQLRRGDEVGGVQQREAPRAGDHTRHGVDGAAQRGGAGRGRGAALGLGGGGGDQQPGREQGRRRGV